MTKELVFDSWKGQEFSQKCPGVNTALHSVGTGVLLLELKLMTHLHLVPRYGWSYIIPHLHMLWWYVQDQHRYVTYMSTILCFKCWMYCMYTHTMRKEFLYKHGYISAHCCENLAYSFICNGALEDSKWGAVWLPDRRPKFYFVLYVDWILQPAHISVQD
jgi:hypothetical protein